MKMVTQILLVLVSTIGISACNPEYYHEPAVVVDYPLLDEFTLDEQLAIRFCLGEHETQPERVDCSIDGQGILNKIAKNIVRLKTHIKEQRIIIEKHNEYHKDKGGQ